MVKENLYSQLKTKLQEKELSDGSINLYLRNLKKLNDNEEFNNLKFLSKPDDVYNKIKDLKDNTQRQYLISIVSCLKALGDKYKPLYKKYYKLMISIHDKIKGKPTEEMTETQKKNWLNWDDILKVYEEMKDKLKLNKTKITEKQYDDLLHFTILSLFVLIQPRRNLDYMKMKITFNSDIEDNKFNYLDVKKKQFIFNVYKTAKDETKNGSLVIDIPDDLMSVLETYIKFHPLNKNMKKQPMNIPFLVYYNGEPLNKVNTITRILNKIFKKNIGASMLRHSFLSYKYGNVLKEQEKDSKAMSHGLQTQKDYIKII
jgi:hypothetical protein